MAFKVSTGLRNHLMDTGSAFDALNGGRIKIYSGTVPSSADAAISGDSTLLVTIDDVGGGLQFEATAADGALLKDSGQTWQGTNAATGAATYYRFVAPADVGNLSTTAVRVQGNVGLAGQELNISNVNLTSGNPQVIDYFALILPTL